MPANRSDRDARGMAEVMALPWGYVTIDTLVRSASMREAAREAGVHHSTMASRLATIERELGFDPLSGFGRTRLGIAFLGWRLRNSRVFDLPGSGQREP
jgi:methyl acetate hydrolase